jgi:HD-GYP domain-containing protein (c-di-GMP phosphodiesterase class II)
MSFQHLKRVKVFAEDLQVGMFVSDLDRDWSESTFLLQGFTIESQADIDAVMSQCKFVYIDFKSDSQFKSYRLATTSSKPYAEKNAHSVESKENFFKNRMNPAATRYKKSSQLMKGVMDRIMLGEDFDIHGVRDVVKENVKQVLENEDAMLMMTLLKNKDDSKAEHSLNVSILSIGFARYLGFDETKLEDIGMGALLHDIGQVKIDTNLISKKGRLNQNEMAEMCNHPKYAFEILQSKSGLTPSCIDIAINHHERLQGQGYPRGLTADKLSQNVRLVSIVDVFESLTTPQVYRRSLSVVDAYKILMSGKGTHYDEKMVLKFIEWRGIYPPGSIVEMANGEVGIIIGTNRKFKLKPKVLLVLDEYKQKRKEKIIDLSKISVDAESKPYKIVKAYENSAFGIDLQSYADKGLKVEPAR